MDTLDLGPASKAAGSVQLPGSKSISNRTLLLAALSEGSTTVHGLLRSDDTEVMLAALKKLGVEIVPLSEHEFQVQGVGGKFPVKEADLFLGNAGTAFRPLVAALAFNKGNYHLSGVPRMHERPIADLVDALRMAGANIRYLGKEGYPPLKIFPATLVENTLAISSVINIRGDVSSQFLSALLMAAPLLQRETIIKVEGELISKPYVEITINMMARFGIKIQNQNWQQFVIPDDAAYASPGQIHVEGDASSASYFLAAGAIAGGPVRVHGVGKSSIQGDVRFAETLAQMGAKIELGDDWIEASAPAGNLKAIDADFNHIPDAAMTIAVVALFAEGTTTLRNIASWRVKETDRIAAMATELRKCGAIVEEGADYLRITPNAKHLTPNPSIDTYDDHRMAMCFSLVALGGVKIRINDPNCVAKTFPEYFSVFQSIIG